MNNNQDIWKRAKKFIPGGNSLLSKRPDMFLPDKWPTYYDWAKGCKVCDMDGSIFNDVSIMGIGTNILGYANEEVNNAVIDCVRKSNMSTLNPPEEVELAEKLTQMHPWAEMARFARTGGEANAIAVRIARIASGRNKIAICGYHGWHDWYLSVNLSDSASLEQHLLPGLRPDGVPQSLKDTSVTFNYNDIQSFMNAIDCPDIGVVIMEVRRNRDPDLEFLRTVREETIKRGIVLIFDECTSGFRETFGGLASLYNIEPDMSMFGKAIGNGFAITAVIGTRAVMEYGQQSFISSTFWTERLGFVSALKVLEVMERDRSWEIISAKGRIIKQKWRDLAKQYAIKLDVSGLDAIPAFSFTPKTNILAKTFITQEMLNSGFLASNVIFCSVAHDDLVLNAYFEKLEEIFSTLSDMIDDEERLTAKLSSPIASSGFTRLN